MFSLILASALIGQCYGGSCGSQSYPSYSYGYQYPQQYQYQYTYWCPSLSATQKYSTVAKVMESPSAVNSGTAWSYFVTPKDLSPCVSR